MVPPSMVHKGKANIYIDHCHWALFLFSHSGDASPIADSALVAKVVLNLSNDLARETG